MDATWHFTETSTTTTTTTNNNYYIIIRLYVSDNNLQCVFMNNSLDEEDW